jgi:Glucodextranase, domain B/FecR protein
MDICAQYRGAGTVRFMGTSRAIGCLLVVACSVGCKSSTASPPIKGAASVPQTGQPAGAPQAVVTASSGKVELLHGGSGAWADAKVGDRLGATDALRTAVGEADLAVEGVKLRLHEASRLEVKSVDKGSMRGRMHGSLESEVDPSAKVDLEIEDTDAVAHSEGGHFFVTSDGKGVVAVATVTGAVHLSAKGQGVDVGKGEISRIDGEGKPPGKPAAALRRVLLSVQWPNARETNQPTVPIAGRVEPGSRVFVQGQQIPVEPGGLFRAEVPLKQGKQKIAIVTVDAMGRRRQVEGVVSRDDSLPGVRVKKKLWQWH